MKIFNQTIALSVAATSFSSCGLDQVPFHEGEISLLEEGMTKREVEKILGSPSHSEGSVWTYTKEGSWSIFHLKFDDRGNLQSYELDR